MRLWLLLLIVLAYLLHQDLWFWRTAEPLIFGFLPIGLAYHALYTFGVSLLMLLLVRFAWPSELERQAEAGERPPN